MSDTGQKMSKTCQNIRTSQTSGQALNSRHGHVHFVAPLRCSALFRPVPPCSSDDALDSTTISSTDLPSGSSNLMAHLETHLTCRATMSNLNISKHLPDRRVTSSGSNQACGHGGSPSAEALKPASFRISVQYHRLRHSRPWFCSNLVL